MHRNRLLRGVPRWRAIGVIAALVSGASTQVASAQISARSIPSLLSQSFTLGNGLRVVLHEDHKAPIVNVYVAYQVGSAAERTGKTGLAHLFEHLMFRGSEHSPGDYATELTRLGATDVLGVTHQDYTRYWQTVPAASLATALWMEAERMCCLLPAITQARLDEQRNVVRNEILEGLNQPFGRTNDLLLSAMYPPGHPYRPAVGDVRDLDSVTVADLTAFFRTYYTPNNAVLVVAGDFIADSARAMIARYFGTIPAGPPVTTGAEWTEPPPSPRRLLPVGRVFLPHFDPVAALLGRFRTARSPVLQGFFCARKGPNPRFRFLPPPPGCRAFWISFQRRAVPKFRSSGVSTAPVSTRPVADGAET